ncbi:MAG TPA: hypothetical protein VF283_10615 [Bryobacteraceae bacterium]
MDSIQTTVRLDEEVLARVKQESEAQGTSLDEALNKLLRQGLAAVAQPKQRQLRMKPHHGGYYPDLSYDCTEALLEHAEGLFHR